MDQRIIDLYDDYVHVHFNRRLFLDRTAKLVGSTSIAAAFLPLLQSNYAHAQTVPEHALNINTERVSFPGATGQVQGYLAAPGYSIQWKRSQISGAVMTPIVRPLRGMDQWGSIVVVHQNRGLNAHIEDIARRLAQVGYTALAVDFLSPAGGTPTTEEEAMPLFSQLDAQQTDANAVAAAQWLRGLETSNGKVGAIGFCWGGGVVNRLAANDPNLSAAVPYYGNTVDAADVPRIRAPLLLNYADPALDTRLGGLLPAYEAALRANGKQFTLYTYEGAQHAFNDNTNQARYNRAAAELAWSRTLAFLAEHLS